VDTTDKAARERRRQRRRESGEDARYRAEHREAIRVYHKAWRDANPDKIKARYVPERSAAYHRKRNYGLTPEEYADRLTFQQGRCAICYEPMTGKGKEKDAPTVDHDHETGIVRGILCMRCNNGLGKFRDRPELLAAAITYLMPYAHEEEQV